jgi:prepilin-type processing-associated H-X9-DG protein/prepilin-type N-terminal cleavage/methylation domain-containing protein
MKLNSSRAFTLVEVLIVIAVIGLLIGLLVPALASVSAASRSTRCLSNLRQMGIAAQNYSVMYDVYPIAIRYEVVDGVFHHVSWDWVRTASQVLSPGALWNFTDHPGDVMQCPEYQGKPNFSEEYTGYNYNTGYIGGEAQPFGALGWSAVQPGVPPHACNRASQCAMFGDAGRKNQTNAYMRGPDSPYAPYSGGQAFRHDGASNVAFVDGHVGNMKTPYEGEHATDSLLAQLGFPQNGFLSNDDSAYDPR